MTIVDKIVESIGNNAETWIKAVQQLGISTVIVFVLLWFGNNVYTDISSAQKELVTSMMRNQDRNTSSLEKIAEAKAQDSNILFGLKENQNILVENQQHIITTQKETNEHLKQRTDVQEETNELILNILKQINVEQK